MSSNCDHQHHRVLQWVNGKSDISQSGGRVLEQAVVAAASGVVNTSDHTSKPPEGAYDQAERNVLDMCQTQFMKILENNEHIVSLFCPDHAKHMVTECTITDPPYPTAGSSSSVEIPSSESSKAETPGLQRCKCFDNVHLCEILVELAWDMLDSAIPDIPISQNASKYLPDNISKEEIHNTLTHITTLATVFGARRGGGIVR